MTELLNKINNSGLSPNEYFLLFSLINNLEVTNIDKEEEYKKLEKKGHLNNKEFTDSLLIKELSEQGLKMRVVEYMQIFPPIILPTGVHARGKLSPVLSKFKIFLELYNYDFPTIYAATEQYVTRYREQGYKYMQNASNFLLDKNGDSTLALECDTLGQHEEPHGISI